jgi:hypothetical protein
VKITEEHPITVRFTEVFLRKCLKQMSQRSEGERKKSAHPWWSTCKRKFLDWRVVGEKTESLCSGGQSFEVCHSRRSFSLPIHCAIEAACQLGVPATHLERKCKMLMTDIEKLQEKWNLLTGDRDLVNGIKPFVIIVSVAGSWFCCCAVTLRLRRKLLTRCPR